MFNIPIPHIFWEEKMDLSTHPFCRKNRSINSAARRNRRLAKDREGIGWFNPILIIGMLVPNNIPAATVAASPEFNLANCYFHGQVYCKLPSGARDRLTGCLMRAWGTRLDRRAFKKGVLTLRRRAKLIYPMLYYHFSCLCT